MVKQVSMVRPDSRGEKQHTNPSPKMAEGCHFGNRLPQCPADKDKIFIELGEGEEMSSG